MAMTAPAPGFDTLTHARRLKEAGVAEAQAEARAETVRAAITEGVATKADIAAVRTDIARLETRMTVRFYGMAAGIVALTVAFIKLLP